MLKEKDQEEGSFSLLHVFEELATLDGSLNSEIIGNQMVQDLEDKKGV